MDYVEGSSYAILINRAPMGFFWLICGLCQGCPLSLYRFILCYDVLFHALWVAIQGTKLEAYKHVPGAQPLLHLFSQMTAYSLERLRFVKRFASLPLLKLIIGLADRSWTCKSLLLLLVLIKPRFEWSRQFGIGWGYLAPWDLHLSWCSHHRVEASESWL